jgi:preprotein translocase subunit SecA
VLVGTVSIEKSEKLSAMLKRRGIKHVVLNAKYHAQEAEIVAQAGRKGAVTIATNMAGRGTDILLGGNPEFMARQKMLADQLAERLPKGQEKFVDDDEYVYFYHLESFYRAPRATYRETYLQLKRETDHEHDEVVRAGGLHIIATERHEARRIDNQLRGRAGRQGDPGSSRFYLSLEDDLMRIFGSDRISGLMQRLGMEEGVPIEHGMVTRAIERAQRQVEAQNFSVRKHLLEYDDVMNKQRENVYGLRRELLEGVIRIGEVDSEETDVVDTRGYLMATAEDLLDSTVEQYLPKDAHPEDWDLDAFRQAATEIFALEGGDFAEVDFSSMGREEIRDAIWNKASQRYDEKEKLLPPEVLRRVERDIMLQVADTQWKDHLYSLDHLKEGIGLRGYGQRDPLVEYKKESFALFTAMRDRVDEEMVRYLWRLRPVPAEDPSLGVRTPQRRQSPLVFNDPSAQQSSFFSGAPRSASAVAEPPRPARIGGDDAQVKTIRRDAPKVGRNDPCWCGSGKKFKKCHGLNA